MNTDNSSISGETIDYGPCAFMDHYDPAAVFSSIDEQGRYAYANQPRIALWNLTRLAECLLPLFSDEQDKAIAEAQDLAGRFCREIHRRPIKRACARRSACSRRATATRRLVQDLLDAMAQQPGRLYPHLPAPRRRRAAIPNMTARSGNCSPIPRPSTNGRRAGGNAPATSRNRPSERRNAMRAVNPAFIPRNHRIEAIIEAAVNRDDYAPFEELLAVLAKPFEDQPEFADYAEPPQPEQRVLQTFCGT